MNKLIIIAITASLVSACSTGPSRSRNRPPPEQVLKPPEMAEPSRPAIEPTVSRLPDISVQSSPAVIELRNQATIATRASDHTRAIGLLERALRIQPDDPQTYHDLAVNHLALNRPQQALQLARKGLRLSPNQAQFDALNDIVDRSAPMVQ